MRKIALLLVIPVLLSSCATMLNSKKQPIAINAPSQSTVKVDGEEPEMKDTRYLVTRDLHPKQITIEKEGYKSENITIMQYKKSPLYVLSVVPFGILIYPIFYDIGPKAYDYDSEITLQKEMVELPRREDDAKEIRLNKVAVDMEPADIRYRYFPNYRNYVRNEASEEAESTEDTEKIEMQNTVFADLLNEVLKEGGYIDTTKRVLKNSYTNNMLINATITEYTIHNVRAGRNYTYGGSMLYVDLGIKWEALDYYQKPIYSSIITSTSGQFAYLPGDEYNEVAYNAIKDAMEYGLIEFMKSDKVEELLHDRSQEELEANFELISFKKPASYVSSISDAVESSVTIKNDKGHGSGFIVSEDGYIVTNYHVVSDTAGLKVVMNNNAVYPVNIVRVSKINDLALVKIEASGLKPFKLNPSKEIEIALDVFAVGTPNAEDLAQTISKGIISGVRNVDDSDSKLIQTDASINSGNSGGAIVNKDGEVIGIVSSKLKGFGIEGVAFGIPAYEVFESLKVSAE